MQPQLLQARSKYESIQMVTKYSKFIQKTRSITLTADLRIISHVY